MIVRHILPTLLLAAPAALAQEAPTPAADAQTSAIVAAAEAFLQTLPDDQRERTLFDFGPPGTATAAEFPGRRITFVGERFGEAVWSNFPVSDVPRPGLRLGDMGEESRAAALDVLEAVLSPEGFEKVQGIMEADQLLSESGTPYEDGIDAYTVGLFGTPLPTEPWMLQWGGHHLGLNVTVVGPDVAIAPTLTGVQPATFLRDGQEVRPLGDENDKAFALMASLDADQQEVAILDYEVGDLVLGPGHDGMVLQPEGLSAVDMTEDQRALLLDLVGEWVEMLNEDDALPKMAQIQADLDETFFAWSGPTEPGSAVYFRVTGPTLHIEFAHQGSPPNGTGVQAPGVNHVHTVYRDPFNAYGAAFTGGS